MWSVNQQKGRAPMPKPKPLTPFVETMVRMHYGRRTLQWIGDRVGCSPVTVVSYAKQLGLWQPTIDEPRGTATIPAAVCSDPIDPFIPPNARAVNGRVRQRAPSLQDRGLIVAASLRLARLPAGCAQFGEFRCVA